MKFLYLRQVLPMTRKDQAVLDGGSEKRVSNRRPAGTLSCLRLSGVSHRWLTTVVWEWRVFVELEEIARRIIGRRARDLHQLTTLEPATWTVLVDCLPELDYSK